MCIRDSSRIPSFSPAHELGNPQPNLNRISDLSNADDRGETGRFEVPQMSDKPSPEVFHSTRPSIVITTMEQNTPCYKENDDDMDLDPSEELPTATLRSTSTGTPVKKLADSMWNPANPNGRANSVSSDQV